MYCTVRADGVRIYLLYTFGKGYALCALMLVLCVFRRSSLISLTQAAHVRPDTSLLLCPSLARSFSISFGLAIACEHFRFYCRKLTLARWSRHKFARYTLPLYHLTMCATRSMVSAIEGKTLYYAVHCVC